MKKEEIKQETLEEVAKKYIETSHYMDKDRMADIIFGAKWQQEQDKNKYSEEEVLQLLLRLQQTESYDNLYDWFGKFKKK